MSYTALEPTRTAEQGGYDAYLPPHPALEHQLSYPVPPMPPTFVEPRQQRQVHQPADFMPMGGLRDASMADRQRALVMQASADLGIGSSKGMAQTWEPWRAETEEGPATGEKKKAVKKDKVLHRNKACLSCRARKTKCDATKPICGSCQKTGATAQCQYDMPPKWLEQVTKGAREAGGAPTATATATATAAEDSGHSTSPSDAEVEGGEAARLQKVIDRLELKLRGLEIASAAEREAKGKGRPPLLKRESSSPRAAGGRALEPVNSPNASSSSSGDSSTSSPNDGSSNTSSSVHLLTQAKPEPSLLLSLSPSSEAHALSYASLHPPPMEPEAQALLESGWPRTLPPRKICRLLCQAFFNRPLAPYMLMDTGRLLYRLSLPASHPHFPQPSLIHAICATGCMEVSMDAIVQPPRPYWGRAAGGPAEYHAQWASRLLWDALEEERDARALHEHAQAAVVLGHWYQTKGMALLLWRSLGYALRVCEMLGYASHTPWVDEEKSEVWDDGVRGIRPAADAVDGYERSTLFWYAVACEKVCCAAAGFAPSFSERDISCPVPSTHAHVPTFECHSHISDSFFECHESDVTGSLQLLSKATLLLGRVTCFVQRSSHPTTTEQEIESGRKALAQLIKRFFDSFPPAYRTPISIDAYGRLDPCLLSVHCQIHSMVIHLHEDAARLSLTDPSLVACANSARILMGWFHQVGALNVDIGVFLCANPTVSFALILALRTQVRMIAVHEKLGYVGAASAVREDLAHVMGRLRDSKNLPMGGRSIMVIDDLMADPSVLLPRHGAPQATDIKSNSSFIRSLRTP